MATITEQVNAVFDNSTQGAHATLNADTARLKTAVFIVIEPKGRGSETLRLRIGTTRRIAKLTDDIVTVRRECRVGSGGLRVSAGRQYSAEERGDIRGHVVRIAEAYVKAGYLTTVRVEALGYQL